MRGTPDLKISVAFIAIMLLKLLPSQYSAIVQTSLTSFESIKLYRIYTILSMESTQSLTARSTSDSALTASSASGKSKSTNQKRSGKKQTCSLGHSGHTNENCKVRQFCEMEKEITELKKDRETQSKPELAQAASSTLPTPTSYWDTAFTCNKNPST